MKNNYLTAFYFTLTIFIIAFILVSYFAVSLAVPSSSVKLDKIKRISILGNYLLLTDDVLKLAGVNIERMRGKVPLSIINKKLKSHRLIKKAHTYKIGNALIISLIEYRPLFRVISGGGKFWLCTDGTLLPMIPDEDKGEIFDAIRTQVTIRADAREVLNEPKTVSAILFSARKLEKLAPRKIEEMIINDNYEMSLVTRNRLLIKVGKLQEVEDIGARIEILPQILREVSRRSRKVRYVDILSNNFALIRYEA